MTNEQKRATKEKISSQGLGKVCTGFFFLSVGLVAILFVVFRWAPDSLRPHCSQLGILSIWVGVLFLQIGKTYFSVVSSLILMLSLAGFSDNLIYKVDQPSNSDPKFVIHGLFSLAWFIAFAVQADLVRTGRVGLHKRIGIAGFLAAIGFTISTIYVFYVLWIPWAEMQDRVQINRILLPSFAILMVLAWVYRKRPDQHKRMILVGTLYLLGPIFGRTIAFFPPAVFVLWNGLFISLFVYDWAVAKKIHPVTYLGTAWFFLAKVVVTLT